MADPLDLNTFLAGFAADGEVDSSGSFTLADDLAHRKLRTYQLQDPRLYSVFLISAAVAAGASRVDIYHEGTGVHQGITYAFDAVMDPGTMKKLGSPQLTEGLGDEARVCFNLNLAVLGASLLSPLVTLTSSEGGEGWVLTMQGEAAALRPLQSGSIGARPVTRLSLSQGVTSGLRRLLSGFPEAQTLLGLCRYAPLEIIVNRRASLTTPVRLGVRSQTLTAWRWLATEGGRGRQLIVQEPALRWAPYARIDRQPSPGCWSAVLAFETPRVAARSGLILVSDGLCFRRDSAILGCPLACGVVAVPGLRRNLSQSDLVENDDYRQLIEQLRSQVAAMLRKRFHASAEFPAEVVGHYVDYAQAHLAQVEPDSDEARELELLAERIRLNLDPSAWNGALERLLQRGGRSESGKALCSQLVRSADLTRVGSQTLLRLGSELRAGDNLVELRRLQERLADLADQYLRSADYARAAEQLAIVQEVFPEAAGEGLQPSLGAALALSLPPAEALLQCSGGGSHWMGALYRLNGRLADGQAEHRLTLEHAGSDATARAWGQVYLADTFLAEGRLTPAIENLKAAYPILWESSALEQLIDALWLARRGSEVTEYCADVLKVRPKPQQRLEFLSEQAGLARVRGKLADWVRWLSRASFYCATTFGVQADPCAGVRKPSDCLRVVVDLELQEGPDSFAARRARRLLATRLRLDGDFLAADGLAARACLIAELFRHRKTWRKSENPTPPA